MKEYLIKRKDILYIILLKERIGSKEWQRIIERLDEIEKALNHLNKQENENIPSN